MKIRHVVLLILITLSVSIANAESDISAEKPFDPFDYNFCGGERVYPIVGVNIATACGPRNQIALGRRGKLMWFFPGQESDGKNKSRKSYQGQIKLSKQQLAKFSTLAEVAKITDPVEPQADKVLYKMGINFSGLQPKYIYAAYSDTYTPGNALLKQLLATLPAEAKPFLPECNNKVTLFDPTLNQNERMSKQINTAAK